MAGGKLYIQVIDSGPGFDPTSSEGLGLAGLRDRIESIGGHFDTSSSRKGTRLTMSLSIEEHQ
jgi:signal transduction histidine kinase